MTICNGGRNIPAFEKDIVMVKELEFALWTTKSCSFKKGLQSQNIISPKNYIHQTNYPTLSVCAWRKIPAIPPSPTPSPPPRIKGTLPTNTELYYYYFEYKSYVVYKLKICTL